MVKVAVMLAQGFEEIEALTVVDVLRRANITCDMVGFEELVLKTSDFERGRGFESHPLRQMPR